MEKLEELIHSDLQQYLLSMNEIDERLPECPDVEGKWETIAVVHLRCCYTTQANGLPHDENIKYSDYVKP